MPGQLLERVTVYKLVGMSRHADLKLKKYTEVIAPTDRTVDKQDFKYSLHFLDSVEQPPSWLSVFNGLPLALSPSGEPRIRLAGFIMLIEVQGAFYAFTGGLGHLALRADNEVEQRFGSVLAEKILSLLELRGLIQKDTSGVVMRLDRVFRGRYNPTGEIDNLRRILSTVRGSLDKTNKLYAKIGRSIQAGNALTVNGTKSFEELFKFLIQVVKLEKSKKKLITIPQLEHIDKKSNAPLVSALDIELVRLLTNYKANGAASVYIDGEDARYLPDVVKTYQILDGHGKHVSVTTYQDLLEQVADILTGLKTVDRTTAYERMRLKITALDESTDARPLSHFISADVVHKNESYFVNSQLWYRADSAFLKHVDEELDNVTCLPPTTFKLISWDTAKYSGTGGENRFNTECCKKGGHLLLDCRTVRIPGEKGPIELCDILVDQASIVSLIHVKKANGAGLRELFAQGLVSADLYRDSQFRELVHGAELTDKETLTAAEKAQLAGLKNRQRREFRIIYAIFDDTPANKMAAGAVTTSKVFRGTLTPFAKVDLLDRVQSIRRMGYSDVAVVRIAPK